MFACASYSLPLGGAFGIPFNIVGKSSSMDGYDGRGWLTVSPGYLQIMSIRILRGREFTDRDDTGAKRVAIINESLARQFWPKGDAVGNRIVLGKGYGPEFAEPAREIVGVVGDVLDIDAKTPRPVGYVPVAQVTDGIISLLTRASSLTWIVKTRSEPHSWFPNLIPAVRNVLQQATQGVPVTNALSLDDTVAESTAEGSFQVTLFFIFGAAALLLAAIGINGVMAYSMRQRTHEIGIRLALGAEPAGVRNMLIRQGMRAGLMGIILGMGTALGVSRLLANSLFGVKPWDPLIALRHE